MQIRSSNPSQSVAGFFLQYISLRWKAGQISSGYFYPSTKRWNAEWQMREEVDHLKQCSFLDFITHSLLFIFYLLSRFFRIFRTICFDWKLTARCLGLSSWSWSLWSEETEIRWSEPWKSPWPSLRWTMAAKYGIESVLSTLPSSHGRKWCIGRIGQSE